jgi:hypothetical protein
MARICAQVACVVAFLLLCLWDSKASQHSFRFHKKSTDRPAKADAFETGDHLEDAHKKIERFRARQRSL